MTLESIGSTNNLNQIQDFVLKHLYSKIFMWFQSNT